MNLIDLLEIAALKSGADEPLTILEDIDIDTRIDKDLLAKQIVVKCGAMCPVYNTSWSFIIWHKHWFEYNKTQISQLIDTMEYEYIPTESYSRYEDLKHNADTKANLDDNTNRTVNENKQLNVDSTDNSTTENQTSAYNESVYQPESKSIFDDKATRGEKENTGRTESENRNYDRTTNFGSTDDNYVHGNNGLFTVQHLIEEQRKLVEFNIIDWIVNKYMKEGFLLVY